VAKKLKHMELNALERDIFASQHNPLNLKLQLLAEEYAHLYEGYEVQWNENVR
jgi:hypothetical protein